MGAKFKLLQDHAAQKMIDHEDGKQRLLSVRRHWKAYWPGFIINCIYFFIILDNVEKIGWMMQERILTITMGPDHHIVPGRSCAVFRLHTERMK